MENQMFTKKEMLDQGFTNAQVKGLVPADRVKTGKPGRPTFLYSQAQVDQLKAEAVVAAVTVVAKKVKTPKTAVTPVEPVVAEVETDEDEVEASTTSDVVVGSDLTEADFQAAA